MCALFDYAGYAATKAPVEEKKTRYIIHSHIHRLHTSQSFDRRKKTKKSSILRLDLFSQVFQRIKISFKTFPLTLDRTIVKTKKKQDSSSAYTYAVFLSLDLTMPCLLAGSLFTNNMSAAYAATGALAEEKKKQDISAFHTYTVFLS